MSKLNDSAFRDWNNGEVMGEADYEQAINLLMAAINDNFDRLVKSFKVQNADGSVATTMTLDTIKNFLQFKKGDNIDLYLDSTTGVLTISVQPIGTSLVQDGAITNVKLSGGITGDKLSDGTITQPKLGFDLQASVGDEYTWTATEGQTVFDLPAGKTYSVNVPGSLSLVVGGLEQSLNAFTQTSTTRITLSEGVAAGVKVILRWKKGLMPTTTVGHQSTHQKGGLDPIRIDTLDQYQELVADKLGNLSKKTVSIDEYPIVVPEVDDTGRFNRIAAQNKAAIIDLTSGTYTLSGKVYVYPNTKFKGQGYKENQGFTKIVCTTDIDYVFEIKEQMNQWGTFVDKGNVEFENIIYYTNNSAGFCDIGEKSAPPNPTSGDSFTFPIAEYVRFKTCFLLSTNKTNDATPYNKTALRAWATTATEVDNCLIEGFALAFDFQYSDLFKIKDTRVRKCKQIAKFKFLNTWGSQGKIQDCDFQVRIETTYTNNLYMIEDSAKFTSYENVYFEPGTLPTPCVIKGAISFTGEYDGNKLEYCRFGLTSAQLTTHLFNFESQRRVEFESCTVESTNTDNTKLATLIANRAVTVGVQRTNEAVILTNCDTNFLTFFPVNNPNVNVQGIMSQTKINTNRGFDFKCISPRTIDNFYPLIYKQGGQTVETLATQCLIGADLDAKDGVCWRIQSSPTSGTGEDSLWITFPQSWLEDNAVYQVNIFKKSTNTTSSTIRLVGLYGDGSASIFSTIQLADTTSTNYQKTKFYFKKQPDSTGKQMARIKLSFLGAVGSELKISHIEINKVESSIPIFNTFTNQVNYISIDSGGAIIKSGTDSIQ